MPAWKRLINRFLTKDERVPLIETIFSDRDEIEVVKCLRGNSAQSFVDVMDEVLLRPFISEESDHSFNSNFPILPGRR